MRHSVRAHTHAATWDGHTLAGTRMGTPPLLKQRKKALESKCVLCQSQDTDTVHAYGQEAIRLVPLLQHLTLPLSPAVHAHTHTIYLSLSVSMSLSPMCFRLLPYAGIEGLLPQAQCQQAPSRQIQAALCSSHCSCCSGPSHMAAPPLQRPLRTPTATHLTACCRCMHHPRPWPLPQALT